jgi:hypothetical protein
VFVVSGATLVNSGQITGGNGGAESTFGNNRAPAPAAPALSVPA